MSALRLHWLVSTLFYHFFSFCQVRQRWKLLIRMLYNLRSNLIPPVVLQQASICPCLQRHRIHCRISGQWCLLAFVGWQSLQTLGVELGGLRRDRR